MQLIPADLACGQQLKHVLYVVGEEGAGSEGGKNLHCDKQPAAHSLHILMKP